MSAKIFVTTANEVLFHCPGCESGHMISVNGSKNEIGAGWQWNGSLDAPTFNPSVLLRGKEMSPKGREEYRAWMNEEIPCPAQLDCVDTVCHSFVRDGKIQFLSDCTHKLAGQTVDLPDWKD